MNNESKWLINIFRSLDYKKILIKAFYKTRSGKHIWFDEDLKGCKEDYVMKAYVKICNWKDDKTWDGDYLNLEKDCNIRLFEVDYVFNHAGILAIPLDALANKKLDDFCKMMFMQIIMSLSNGNFLKFGKYGPIMLSPEETLSSLIECDLIV